MNLKISKARKPLVFVLTFAMVLTYMITAGIGQKDNWRAYAADAANAQYSLSGAEYWVYTNQSCTTRAKDADGNNAVLTTNASGETNEIELDEGTYYVKEVKSSKGYILDSSVHSMVVKSGDTTLETVQEVPQSAPIQVKKVDVFTGNPVKDVVFDVSYTDGSSVTRNWKIRTDANGIADLEDSHFVSGDTRYKNSQGKYVVPIGTVTVS